MIKVYFKMMDGQVIEKKVTDEKVIELIKKHKENQKIYSTTKIEGKKHD